MAIQVFDLGSAQNRTGATLTITGVTVPAGALICVQVDEDSGTIAGTGLSDSGGSNVYSSQLAGGNNNSSSANGYSILFYVANASGLNNATLTFTKGISGSKCAMSAFYATGVSRHSPFDTSFNATATGNSATPSVTSNAPSQGGELVVGLLGWTAGDTDTFAQDSTHGAFATPPDSVSTTFAAVGGGWIINSGVSAVTYAPTLNNAQPWSLQIVAFLPEINPGWMGDARDQTELIRAMNAPVMVPY